MFEFISANSDIIALLITVFAGFFGFIKWLDTRTLNLKNERYDKYILLIGVLSGAKDNKDATIPTTVQIASAWLLLEYKEYYPITVKIFDNPDLEKMSNENWREFVLPQIKLVIEEINSKR